MKKLLRKLEWSGQVGCPACKAIGPFKIQTSKNGVIRGGGKHETWCPLDAALKVPATPDFDAIESQPMRSCGSDIKFEIDHHGCIVIEHCDSSEPIRISLRELHNLYNEVFGQRISG